MFLTFFIIMLICFTLIRLLPVQEAARYGTNAQLIQMRREAMGYNKPIIQQFFIYWYRVMFHGDWGLGEEMMTGREVSEIFAGRLPATVIVNLYSIIFSFAVYGSI